MARIFYPKLIPTHKVRLEDRHNATVGSIILAAMAY